MAKEGYQDRVIEHSRQWVYGRPTHNYIDEECVADFSCCLPELFTEDRDKREESHFHLLRKLGRLS